MIWFSILLITEPSPRLNTESGDERKALNEVKNIPSQGVKKPGKIKRTISSTLKANGSENQPVQPSKRPKVFHKPHSSSSISSSDEDSMQSRQHGVSRPGTTPGRSIPVHGMSKTPGFSFGSGKKVVVKKSVTKFNPENKRKRKLLKPVNTASSLGVKL